MKNSGCYCVVLRSPPSRRSGLKCDAMNNRYTFKLSPSSRRSGLKYVFGIIFFSGAAEQVKNLSNTGLHPVSPFLLFSQTSQFLLNCRRLGRANFAQHKRWGNPHLFHNLTRMYKKRILPLPFPSPNLPQPRHQHLGAGFQNDPSLFGCGP